MAKTPVLMFHGLEGSGAPVLRQSVADAFYTVTDDVLRRCLNWIHAGGRHTITTAVLDAPADVPPSSVMLTFDDGWRSDYTHALPALLEAGMAASFFVVTDWLGTEPFLTTVQVREMVERGMDVQLHGKSHQFLAGLPTPELRRQLAEAKAMLEDLTGKAVTSLSYPGGRGSARVRAVGAELGLRHFFSSAPGWYTGRQREVPRYVIHSRTDLAQVQRYLAGARWPVWYQRGRRLAGRVAASVLGRARYARVKAAVGG